MKIAMFVKLTKMIGGSSSGPPTLVLTKKSTSPVVTTQLGSPASLASDKKENISQLLGTGHFVIEVVKVTLLEKVGRMVDSSGVLNSCADISGRCQSFALVRYAIFVSLIFLLRNLLVESPSPQNKNNSSSLRKLELQRLLWLYRPILLALPHRKI